MARKQTVKLKTNKKTRIKQKYPIVRIFLRAEFNNSIVTLTDLQGKVIAWTSSGKVGFKGSKKSTPFAAQKATEEILERVRQVEASTVHLEIDGAGMGRDSFLRTIQATDLMIESIKDVTGFPFGGVRPKKKRRV
ncbi:MAG: 30S ribosomal protein S11 [Patescibacteria group bacterium]